MQLRRHASCGMYVLCIRLLHALTVCIWAVYSHEDVLKRVNVRVCCCDLWWTPRDRRLAHSNNKQQRSRGLLIGRHYLFCSKLVLGVLEIPDEIRERTNILCRTRMCFFVIVCCCRRKMGRETCMKKQPSSASTSFCLLTFHMSFIHVYMCKLLSMRVDAFMHS